MLRDSWWSVRLLTLCMGAGVRAPKSSMRPVSCRPFRVLKCDGKHATASSFRLTGPWDLRNSQALLLRSWDGETGHLRSQGSSPLHLAMHLGLEKVLESGAPAIQASKDLFRVFSLRSLGSLKASPAREP